MFTHRNMVVTIMSLMMLAMPGVVAAQTAADEGRVTALVNELFKELERLREEVATLRAQVHALEGHLDASGEPPAPARLAADAPQRIMRLEGMDTQAVESDVADEVARLLDQADALEERAREAEEQAIGLGSEPWEDGPLPPWWDEEEDRREHWQDAVRRQQAELRKQAVQYRVEARHKRGEARRLQRTATQIRQIFWGWDGRQTVILEADRDLGGSLGRIGGGGFVTWQGKLAGIDAHGQTWHVTSLRPVLRPPGFTDRPSDRSTPQR